MCKFWNIYLLNPLEDSLYTHKTKIFIYLWGFRLRATTVYIMYYDHAFWTRAQNLFLYIYICVKMTFFFSWKTLGQMNPHFGTYIYVPKCTLLIENLLKKPCSAENSNHYQDAFWHIYICTKVWVHFPKSSSGLKFFTWVPQNHH